jgi:hypothetical protein
MSASTGVLSWYRDVITGLKIYDVVGKTVE